MPTSYTSLLGFALPVTGELQGTWGTTVNDSITELVEDAIAATATASVTSGNWTLSTTGSGSANEARCAILVPTGTPGVSRNIVAPSQSKAYIVINQSDAAVVVKGSATTGTTIAAGDRAVVAWNGSDFVTIASTATDGVSTISFGTTGLTPSTGTSGAVTVAGTLAVANGGTGQTTSSAAFNALSPITTTGDLIIGNGTNSATRLGIGSNGFVLTSNGTTATWAASTGGVTSFSAGTTGLTPSTGTTGAITLAGTLAVANGGTGQTTYTDGQLLIGNSTGNTLSKSTLTAGSGITITNGSGTITIASTGSLPSQTGNAGKYLTTDGTTASWGAITGALATPTFTPSTTTPASGATITVTITNYNAGYTYTIAVSGGSYTFNTGTGVITWTVPAVGVVTSASLTAFAQSGVQSSLVGTQTVSVQAASGTDTISITNFASYSLNNGWAI